MPTPSQLDASGDAVRQVIRAYHGSPYDFDRFDASKIGTGEGAQAYGYGHYFAQVPDVSETYRDTLKNKVVFEPPQELVDAHTASRLHARKVWDSSAASMDDRLAAIRLAEEAERRLQAATQNPGRMYEVEIDAPESSLLDWDAPLSMQPNALKFFQKMSVALPQEPPLKALDRVIEVDGSGGWAYGRLQDALSENAQTWKMPDAQGRLLSKQLVSNAVRDGGFPGIRYLDQASRQQGINFGPSGTRNYVMFPGTEDQIRILRKYGLMAPIAAGAAASGASEPPAQ
jgi:hypothetical protein